MKAHTIRIGEIKMAGRKIAGVDVLLKIADEDGTLQVVGGQTGATLNREAETIDTTDKTTGGFASVIAGTLSWSVDADGFIVLGNEAVTLLEDIFLGRKQVMLEIRLGADDDSDGITYTGNGYLVDFPLEFAQDDAVTYSISIEGDGKLERIKGTKTDSE